MKVCRCKWMEENKLEELIILEPGERLREARKKLGLTQQDLAGENMSKNYISMFENGKRHINIVNATYFANVLNKKAKEQRIDLNFEASYFVKSDKDIARDKSMEWIRQILHTPELNNIHIYRELYKTIYLSKKYELEDLLALAYKIKVKYLYKGKLYTCAKVHFLSSLFHYIQIEDYTGIKNSYVHLGKTSFIDQNYEMAIVYYNLAGEIENQDEIQYYKALSYSKLGNYHIAKSICNRIIFKDEKTLELEDFLSNID